jgi:uncharacterized membrane protein YqjE
MPTDQEHGRPTDASVGELISQMAAQTSTLVRQELELAKVELSEKGKQAGVGVGMFGAAGIVALFAVGALVAAAIIALGTAIALWLSAVIVAAVLGVVAGVLALSGRGHVRQATPATPEETVETVREDVRFVRERAKEGRA